jgi:hypothetical protein
VSTPVYEPNTPAIAQDSDWSCAITSARWGMTAFGRHPTQEWIEATSLAEGVESRDLGLMDGTGAGLAAFLTEQYAEFGYGAYNVPVVAFNDVLPVAGLSPVLVGGHDWNHWTGVRRYDPSTGTLALANPSAGWMDIGQSLGRADWDRLGPFSMIVITWTDPAGPPAPPPLPDVATLQARISDLEGQVAALSQQRDGLVSTLGYIRGDVADAIQAAVDTLRRVGA